MAFPYLFLLFLSSPAFCVDVRHNSKPELQRSLAAKDEQILRLFPGQYIGSLLQESAPKQTTSDWLFAVEHSTNDVVVEEGFVPPIFVDDEENDFPTLKLNNQTNVATPVHVVVSFQLPP